MPTAAQWVQYSYGASQAWEDILGSHNMYSFDLMALLFFLLQHLHAPFCCSVWKMFSHVPVNLIFHCAMLQQSCCTT